MFSTRDSTSGRGLAPTNELHCGHVDWTSVTLRPLIFLQNVPMACEIFFPEAGVIRSPCKYLLRHDGMCGQNFDVKCRLILVYLRFGTSWRIPPMAESISDAKKPLVDPFRMI